MGGWGSSMRLIDPAYSVPLLALPGLIWAYRRKSAAGVGLYVMLFNWWMLVSRRPGDSTMPPIFWVGSVGACFC